MIVLFPFSFISDVLSVISSVQLYCVCLKGYHVHIRSISHNQNMAEAKKKKMQAKTGLAPGSADQASSAGLRSEPTVKSGRSQESTEEKRPRGPNYCDVCCFEFSSAEVNLLCEFSEIVDAIVYVTFVNFKPHCRARVLLIFGCCVQCCLTWIHELADCML